MWFSSITLASWFCICKSIQVFIHTEGWIILNVKRWNESLLNSSFFVSQFIETIRRICSPNSLSVAGLLKLGLFKVKYLKAELMTPMMTHTPWLCPISFESVSLFSFIQRLQLHLLCFFYESKLGFMSGSSLGLYHCWISCLPIYIFLPELLYSFGWFMLYISDVWDVCPLGAFTSRTGGELLCGRAEMGRGEPAL